MSSLNESTFGDAALEWYGELGYYGCHEAVGLIALITKAQGAQF